MGVYTIDSEFVGDYELEMGVEMLAKQYFMGWELKESIFFDEVLFWQVGLGMMSAYLLVSRFLFLFSILSFLLHSQDYHSFAGHINVVYLFVASVVLR